MNQKRPDRSPWAVFALSFSISLAVLLILVMTVLSLTVSPRQAQSEPSGQVTEAFQYQPGIKESMNVLFISCRQRSDPPFAYTLVRFDAPGERLIFIPIPPETLVTVGAKTGSFRKHYDYAGSANARLAAESLFLCEVDRYVRVAKAGAVNLIDALGGLEHRFDEGYETDAVSVPAGNHLLSGELLYEISASPPEDVPLEGWRAGLFRELCDQRLQPELVRRLDYLWEVFWNNTDTDLSRFDCTARQRAAEYFLKSDTRTVEVRPLTGTWDKGRTVFTPEKSALSELRLLLGAEESTE